MARVIIGHLAPAQTVEIEFLCDLAREFHHHGHECLIWSGVYPKAFAPYYLPLNWRLKEWRKYYRSSFIDSPSDLASRLDLEKWRVRVDQLPKQDWGKPNRDELFNVLVNASCSVIEHFQPDLFLAWNTFCPHTGVAYDLCKSLGIPALLIERAVFPHTWFIEPGGLVGKSCIAGTPLGDLIPHGRLEEYRSFGESYLREISFETYNRYAQVQESEAMKRILSPPLSEMRPRVALFPPDDGTLGFWPVEGSDRKATLPYYENSFEAVKRLSLAHEGITIFKPHPSFLEKTFDTTGYPNLHVVDYDFRRVMEWADIVASTGTGLEFVAAGMGKPVLLMANDIFAGKSIAYEAQDPVDLPMAIAQAQANTDAAERRRNFQAFTGYLMKDFLISPRDANPGFRQPVDVVRDLIRDYLPGESRTHSSQDSMPDRYPVLSREWANKLKVDTQKEHDRQMELRGQPLTDRGILFRTLKRGEGTHLVLDFDYTLFKNNSTDAFLKMLRPAWLAFFLITVSDTILKNLARWKLANYERWRDFFRVAITSLFFPWKVYFWRKRAEERMKELGNQDLIETVLAANPSKVTVISFGFQHLVRPLVEQIPFQAKPEIICSRIWPKPFNLRKKGKVEALRPSLPPDQLTEAVFVTDSHDDKDLLGYIPNSYLLQWGEYAGKPYVGVYFPLRYTLEGKYPARRYLWNQLVKEEFLLLLLAYDLTITNGCALIFLFLSLMTVYDAGYYENDHLASKSEKQPNVSPQALAFTKYSLWPAMIWVPVFVLAAFGLFSLGATLPLEGSIADRWLPGFHSWAADGVSPWWFPLALWFVFLILLQGVFTLFNRVPTVIRIFLFPLLHTLKVFGYGLILPLTHLGGVLLASQVLIQTITYNIYRHGGAIDKFNRQAYRLVIFTVLLVPLWLTSLSLKEIVCDWRFVLILLWGGYRALERQYGAGFVKGGIKKAIRLWKEFWHKPASSSAS